MISKNVPAGQIRWSLYCLSAVSGSTTFAGIQSLSPAISDNLLEGLTWLILAIAFSLAISLGILALSLSLYDKFELSTLLSLVFLASVAMLFDTAFFQSAFVHQHSISIAVQSDRDNRIHEKDRLTKKLAEIKQKTQTIIQPRRLAALKKKKDASSGIEYEISLRRNVSERGCGPKCRRYMTLVAESEATLEEINDLTMVVKNTRSSPKSNSWNDLSIFHSSIMDLFAELPPTINVKIPNAPSPPTVITRGGNLENLGGLSLMAEMITNGEFGETRLLVPLFLAAITEYLGILLILGIRPAKNTFLEWGPKILWDMEHMIDTMPAIIPSLKHLFARGFLNDDDTRKSNQQRRKREKAILESAEDLNILKDHDENVRKYMVDVKEKLNNISTRNNESRSKQMNNNN